MEREDEEEAKEEEETAEDITIIINSNGVKTRQGFLDVLAIGSGR